MSAAVANGTSQPKKAMTDAPRKRLSDPKSAAAPTAAAKPAPQKRRRVATTAAPKAKAGAKAKVSVKAKASAKANKASMVDNSDSESGSGSDSDSSDSDSSSDSSDSSSESGEEGATAPKTTPKAVPKAAPKATPKAVPKSSSAVSASKSTPTPTPTPTAATILGEAKKRLTADAMEELIPLILKAARPSAKIEDDVDDGRVMVINSLPLQALLNRHITGRSTVTSEDVYKMLGVSRGRVEAAEALVVVLHGPNMDTSSDNYHWSLVCWFRSMDDHAFHYDSRYPLNDQRCSEVLGILRSLEVIPKSVKRFTLPSFFPQQDEEWECGYYALIALTIIASKTDPAPILETETETTYSPFFTTLATGGKNAPFVRRMRELLQREKYLG